MPIYTRSPYHFQAMVRGGQRRILKRGIPVDEYIQKAVISGTYRTTEELEEVAKERYDNPDDLRNIMRRFRQDIVRGSNVQDYPDEYLILTQHPPIPDPPQTPKRLLHKLLRPQESHVEKWTKRYMAKFCQDYNGWSNAHKSADQYDADVDPTGATTKGRGGPDHPTTADEFYRRLYGAQSAQAKQYKGQQKQGLPPYGSKDPVTPLSQKPAIIQTAYAAALHHYQLQHTVPGLSDEEAMAQVEALLKSAVSTERTVGQERTEKIKNMRDSYEGWSVRDLRDAEVNAATQANEEEESSLSPASTWADAALWNGDNDTDASSVGRRPEAAEEEKETNPLDSSDLFDDNFLMKGESSSASAVSLDPFQKTASAATDSKTKGEPTTTKASPPDDDDTATPLLHEQLASIFDADANVLEGMMRWSERLAVVNYNDWTIGAATALDHWIARRLLKYSEETWANVLEGNDPNLLDLGKNIVIVRESLFPETVPAAAATVSAARSPGSQLPGGGYDDINNTKAVDDAASRIDDELSDLFDAVAKSGRNRQQQFLQKQQGGAGGGIDTDIDDDPFYDPTMKVPEATDEVVEQLVYDLNRYRDRHHNEEPYEVWNANEKKQFEQWMRRYVAILSQGKPGPAVDYVETREALLAVPPVQPDESAAFWDQLQNTGRAEALLDMMTEHGPPPGATILQGEFWNLSRPDQLQRLLNLGALRPLLDEYTKESARTAFIQKHANTLLTGVPLEYLVSDPTGPIAAADLSADMRTSLQINEGDRFRIETRPFVSSTNDPAWNRSRQLFQAWAEFKAGRARYEERMFQTGRLGLRYSDDTEEKYDIEVELGVKEPENKY
jgi:hypothetical protein